MSKNCVYRRLLIINALGKLAKEESFLGIVSCAASLPALAL